MKMNTTSIGLGLAALTLFASLAYADGRRAGEAQQDGIRARHGRAARFERRADAREFVRGLEFTEGQRALAREHAQSLAPAAEKLRGEAREILRAARERAQAGDREGARTEARAALTELRERMRAETTPHGRVLLGALTPEQRARLEARATERGRTFDPERASARIGRFLARPRAADRLSADRADANRTGTTHGR